MASVKSDQEKTARAQANIAKAKAELARTEGVSAGERLRQEAIIQENVGRLMQTGAVVEIRGERQAFAMGGPGGKPEQPLKTAPVTTSQVTTEKVGAAQAAAVEQYYERQDPGKDYRVFRTSETLPWNYVPVYTLPEQEKTTKAETTGWHRYTITAGSLRTEEPGKPTLMEYAQMGYSYNVASFLTEAQAKGYETRQEGAAWIVEKPIKQYSLLIQPSDEPGYVIARPSTKGEEWLTIGRERMHAVEELPGFKQLGQLQEAIIGTSAKTTGHLSSVALAARPGVIGYTLETMSSLTHELIKPGASLLGIPTVLAKTGVGGITMLQQAATDTGSFSENLQRAAIGAPIAAGVVGTAFVESAKAEPRTLLYGAATIAGGYLWTTGAIEAGGKAITWAKGGPQTKGASDIYIKGTYEQEGRTTYMSEFTGRGITDTGVRKISFDISGTSESMPRPGGLTPFTSKGEIAAKLSTLRGTKTITMPYTEAGVASGMYYGPTPITYTPKGITPAGYAVQLGPSGAIPPGFSATGTGTGGTYYFTLSKGALETQKGAIGFAKGALSKEVLKTDAETVFFSYGRQVLRTGGKSTLTEVSTVHELMGTGTGMAEMGGTAARSFTFQAGGSGTGTLRTVLGTGGQGAGTTGMDAAAAKLSEWSAQETAKDVGLFGAGTAGTSALTGTRTSTSSKQEAATMQAAGMSAPPPPVLAELTLSKQRSEISVQIPSMEDMVTQVTAPTTILEEATRQHTQQISTPLTIQETFTGTRTSTTIEPAAITAEDTQLKTGVVTLTGESEITQQKTTTTAMFEMMPVDITPSITSIIPPFFPDLGGGGRGQLGPDLFGEQPKSYAPSLTAIGMGLTGEQPKGTLTGFELRPMKKGRKAPKMPGLI